VKQAVETRLQEFPSTGIHDENTIDQAWKILDTKWNELFTDEPDELEDVENRLVELRKSESEKRTLLESTSNRIEELKDEKLSLNDEIEELTQKLDSFEDERERFRDESGLTDHSTYKEELNQKRKLKTQLQSKIDKLSVTLDVDQEKPDVPALETAFKNEITKYEAVTTRDQSVQKLEEELDSMRQNRNSLKQNINEIEGNIRELDDRIDSRSSSLVELGIDLEEPEQLFERRHEWSKELEEAVTDRLAANLILQKLDVMEGSYIHKLRGLLEGENQDGWSISDLYRMVMGEQYEVNFDVDRLRFEVNGDESSYDESQLSTGAFTHLYFSCRLVVLRYLFAKESGFVILDDPFLSYFPKRKKKTVQLLETFIEEGWQILLFTIDRESRDHFRNMLNAEVKSIEELRD
jgi:DNA repair exonuclease SbcCD ATPase subunit